MCAGFSHGGTAVLPTGDSTYLHLRGLPLAIVLFVPLIGLFCGGIRDEVLLVLEPAWTRQQSMSSENANAESSRKQKSTRTFGHHGLFIEDGLGSVFIPVVGLGSGGV